MEKRLVSVAVAGPTSVSFPLEDFGVVGFLSAEETKARPVTISCGCLDCRAIQAACAAIGKAPA